MGGARGVANGWWGIVRGRGQWMGMEPMGIRLNLTLPKPLPLPALIGCSASMDQSTTPSPAEAPPPLHTNCRHWPSESGVANKPRPPPPRLAPPISSSDWLFCQHGPITTPHPFQSPAPSPLGPAPHQAVVAAHFPPCLWDKMEFK